VDPVASSDPDRPFLLAPQSSPGSCPWRQTAFRALLLSRERRSGLCVPSARDVFCRIWTRGRQLAFPKGDVVALMQAKIEELAEKGLRVSNHVTTVAKYAGLNIGAPCSAVESKATSKARPRTSCSN
jgi:hypothetical protein